MLLTTTKQNTKFINCLIYGKSGIGKTTLAATAPRPLIIDTEGGTLSLSNHDIDMVSIRSMEELNECAKKLAGKAGKNYDTIFIDSGSELVEIVLLDLKEKAKDKRQAYMEVGEEAIKVFRKFKDLPKHLVVTAKMRISNVDNSEKYRASFPGNVLTENLPYLFDEVFCLRISDDDDNEDESTRFLQTQPDEDFDAKDRSNKLKKREEPNLTNIFNKILSKKSKKKKE